MPLINMKDMLNHAYQNCYAIGAFDLVSLDFLQAIMIAAERTQAPIILSLAESHFEYFDFELIMSAVETAAKRASVPVAIHLDHGTNLTSAVTAIKYGCNGVMIDASQQVLAENIATTHAVVNMAHACGIPVEAELGYVPGVEGEDAVCHLGNVIYTTAEDAKKFVDQTGADFLAVSIGTVHGNMQGKAKLDFSRLQKINEILNIPLVIHGGTGLSEQQFIQLITHGVTKINYYTALSDIAAKQIDENMATNSDKGYTGLVNNIGTVIAAEVERCNHLWDSAGRANELLASCKPWLPIMHLIIYNVNGISKIEAEIMITEGRQILSTIPDVRDVFTCDAVQDNDAYRYTWLISFCHPAVINSYRKHPAHVDFADKLFRPVAGERISIDYQTLV